MALTRLRVQHPSSAHHDLIAAPPPPLNGDGARGAVTGARGVTRHGTLDNRACESRHLGTFATLNVKKYARTDSLNAGPSFLPSRTTPISLGQGPPNPNADQDSIFWLSVCLTSNRPSGALALGGAAHPKTLSSGVIMRRLIPSLLFSIQRWSTWSIGLNQRTMATVNETSW
ncbi:uncharacterized protein EI97DRAFT_315651 [Westerdykella ornata]|uniref:Uncharacterized protein n=1 Tax=Westerdykella ornata TaxID=318751 RepID=A0A6A6JL15_WESOR|nr:uncharacterized protein EI97DRAFT_315651 [Westerdykella ornata]KAF2277281.1 hypothetical protein EI97DRAFT_315651 [Westerdykella ornata]